MTEEISTTVQLGPVQLRASEALRAVLALKPGTEGSIISTVPLTGRWHRADYGAERYSNGVFATHLLVWIDVDDQVAAVAVEAYYEEAEQPAPTKRGRLHYRIIGDELESDLIEVIVVSYPDSTTSQVDHEASKQLSGAAR